MQTYGRGMRADDDYCTTYIIDKSLKSIMNRPLYKKLIQDSFKEAIINPEEL
jgi:Rad3-related DNA helicase